MDTKKGLFVVALLAVAGVCEAGELGDRYFRSVFSGDLAWVTEAEAQTPEDQALLERFRERFLDRHLPDAVVTIDDPLVGDAAALFVNYWIDSLLDPASLEQYEQELERRIVELLDEHVGPSGATSALDQLATAIRNRGWGFQGGRTTPLLDFILWRETVTQEYSVELTDRVQPVTVHFLVGFVSQGWSHFATFGRSGTGGWADSDALYCVRDSYDLESEDFRLSYLKHEARHFADYQLHPQLDQESLEYRAKLTELSYAEATQMAILKRFTAHADEHSTAPHPRANWRVLSDLANALGLKSQLTKQANWSSVTGTRIRSAARALLAADERRLSGVH